MPRARASFSAVRVPRLAWDACTEVALSWRVSGARSVELVLYAGLAALADGDEVVLEQDGREVSLSIPAPVARRVLDLLAKAVTS